MSDSYQAIYDAVRSKISGGDVSYALREVLFEQFDISFEKEAIKEELLRVAFEQQRPSVLFRPKIYLDQKKWCALYGDNLHDGVAGFGDTPAEAMRDFDVNWEKKINVTD